MSNLRELITCENRQGKIHHNDACETCARCKGRAKTRRYRNRHAEPYESVTGKQLKLFWSRVTKTETCWLWTGAQQGYRWREGKGYGHFRVNRKSLKAHRLSYLLRYGSLPKVSIRQSCGNHCCVNPEHLFSFAGKGRHPRRLTACAEMVQTF